MNEREAWQFIGEAFEKFAETGEKEDLTNCGICHALYNVEALDRLVYSVMYDKVWDCVRDEKRVATLCDYGQDYAADRAMFCYLNVAMLKKVEETENV